jgi:predicted dehydrogenase
VIGPARGSDDFEVTAIAARDPSRAASYAREHDIPATAATYEALISRDDVDVVYNALPPAGHARWTIAALEAGKAVLCEKPFALNAGEARAMVDAARRAGKPLLEAAHYRFHDVMRRAEALVRSGALGRVQTATARFDAPIARTAGELRWRADQGGGALMDLGFYPLHALRTLIGGEPEIVRAEGVFVDGVDASLRADLRFEGGVEASISCSMTEPTPAAALAIVGDAGSLEIVNFIAPQMGSRFTVTLNGRAEPQPTDGPSTYAAQLRHLRAVLDGAPALTGGADAINNMAAIDAIYRAAR